MSTKHPIISVVGSSGAGTKRKANDALKLSYKKCILFEHLF